MKELATKKSPVNVPVLDAELRSKLGANYLGLSTKPGEVIVFLEDKTPSELVQQAQTIVAAHDASVLSGAQKAELARQAALASARSEHPAPLDLDGFEASEQAVQTLARYLAWLELEIRDLRRL